MVRPDNGAQFEFLSLLLRCIVLQSFAGSKFDVLRDRHTLVRERANGSLENLYTFKFTNEDDRAHRFILVARLNDGTAMEAIPSEVTGGSGRTSATPVTLRLPPQQDRLATVVDVTVQATAADAPAMVLNRDVRFVTSEGH